MSLIVLGVYLFSARGVPMVFDEAIIFDTTAALVHGQPDIHTPLLQRFPGLAVQRADGRKVGIYGIGTSIVGVPPYLVGKAVAQISPAAKRAQIVLTATMFTNALVVAATVFMLMLVCMLLRAPPAGAVLVGLSYGLGSYAFPHALTLFTEPGTALCVLTAVYYAIRAARGGARARSDRVRRVGRHRAAVPRLGRVVPPDPRAVAARRRVAHGRPYRAPNRRGGGACSSSARGSPPARSVRCC